MSTPDTSDLTIGVLSLHESKESKAILNAIDDLGYGTEWLREENVAIEIEDREARLEPPVDLVANRLLLSSSEQPIDHLGLAATIGNLAPMLNPPGATLTALNKIASATRLANEGIPVPDALLALGEERLNAGRDRFGSEAVYKTAVGTHGGGTWKVSLDSPVNPQVGHRQAFLQQLVETDGGRARDVRVYVVGDEVIGAMTRYAPEGDWRTNVALGGAVEDATDSLPDEVVEIAKRAVEVIGLDYAGVDVIASEENPQVLEVNPTAGFRGLFAATGRSAGPYIAKLAIERAGGSADAERVAELSRTLDDATPACTPKKGPAEPTEPIPIGYIEAVTVTGTRDTKTVYAKSDTGADRTSIDSTLAAEIGTGPIKDIVRVRSGSSSGKSRPVVDLVVGIGGRQYTVAASVEDRSHMNYSLLLGRDVLQHYHVDVRQRADTESTLEDPRLYAEE